MRLGVLKFFLLKQSWSEFTFDPKTLLEREREKFSSYTTKLNLDLSTTIWKWNKFVSKQLGRHFVNKFWDFVYFHKTNGWHSRNTQFPKFGIHQPFLGTTAICEDLGQRTHHRGEVSLNGWPLVWLVCIWPSKKQRVHCTSPRQNKQEVSRTVILSLKLELYS